MIIAKAYGTNVTTQLYNVSSTTSVGTGTAILGQGTEGEARMDVTFSVTNKEHAYTIRQQCASSATFSCTLGFAKMGTFLIPTKILTIACDRWDVMM